MSNLVTSKFSTLLNNNDPGALPMLYPVFVGFRMTDKTLVNQLASFFSRTTNCCNETARSHPFADISFCHIEFFLPPPPEPFPSYGPNPTPEQRLHLVNLREYNENNYKDISKYIAISAIHRYGTYSTHRNINDGKYIFYYFMINHRMLEQLLQFAQQHSHEGFGIGTQICSIMPRWLARMGKANQQHPDGWTCAKFLRAAMNSMGLMHDSTENPDLLTFVVELDNSLHKELGGMSLTPIKAPGAFKDTENAKQMVTQSFLSAIGMPPAPPAPMTHPGEPLLAPGQNLPNVPSGTTVVSNQNGSQPPTNERGVDITNVTIQARATKYE